MLYVGVKARHKWLYGLCKPKTVDILLTKRASMSMIVASVLFVKSFATLSIKMFSGVRYLNWMFPVRVSTHLVPKGVSCKVLTAQR